METKLCRKCGRKLPISSFNVDHHMHDHLACYCRDCVHANVKARNMLYTTAIKLGRNPKLAKFSTADLIEELSVRLSNAYM